ncbi:MAG: pantoate--beta-alanine ligase [Gammaproteobacteria bacterium]|nr:pantoate--beta-alanine ligase [Gammaproteobacteria bacterium]
MIICKTIGELRQRINDWKQSGKTIAFVPTMGNLHAGHIALVKKARTLADIVVVSIFVNPLQFDETADFAAYPRTADSDREKLAAVAADVLFMPAVESVYPLDQAATTKVVVPALSDILEGEWRPGHFTGVATVVNKLFNMVMPDVAIFGDKDYQQLALIRRMVAELNMPIDIVSVATVRESDGLAMSSRNSRLDSQQRQLAPALYQALTAIREKIQQGDRDYSALEVAALEQLNARGIQPEYVVVRRSEDLEQPEAKDRELVLLGAVRMGATRLIDNISLTL